MADIDKALPNEPRKEFNLPGEKELQEQIVEEVQAQKKLKFKKMKMDQLISI